MRDTVGWGGLVSFTHARAAAKKNRWSWATTPVPACKDNARGVESDRVNPKTKPSRGRRGGRRSTSPRTRLRTRREEETRALFFCFPRPGLHPPFRLSQSQTGLPFNNPSLPPPPPPNDQQLGEQDLTHTTIRVFPERDPEEQLRQATYHLPRPSVLEGGVPPRPALVHDSRFLLKARAFV